MHGARRHACAPPDALARSADDPRVATRASQHAERHPERGGGERDRLRAVQRERRGQDGPGRRRQRARHAQHPQPASRADGGRAASDPQQPGTDGEPAAARAEHRVERREEGRSRKQRTSGRTLQSGSTLRSVTIPLVSPANAGWVSPLASPRPARSSADTARSAARPNASSCVRDVGAPGRRAALAGGLQEHARQPGAVHLPLLGDRHGERPPRPLGRGPRAARATSRPPCAPPSPRCGASAIGGRPPPFDHGTTHGRAVRARRRRRARARRRRSTDPARAPTRARPQPRRCHPRWRRARASCADPGRSAAAGREASGRTCRASGRCARARGRPRCPTARRARARQRVAMAEHDDLAARAPGRTPTTVSRVCSPSTVRAPSWRRVTTKPSAASVRATRPASAASPALPGRRSGKRAASSSSELGEVTPP